MNSVVEGNAELVIAGLDPAIHLFCERMDALFEPGHDERWRGVALGSADSIETMRKIQRTLLR